MSPEEATPEPIPLDGLDFIREALGRVTQAVFDHQVDRERSTLAMASTYVFALMDLSRGVPDDVACTLLSCASLWFRSAAVAWARPEWFTTALDLGAQGLRLAPPGPERSQHSVNLATTMMSAVDFGADPVLYEQAHSLLSAVVAGPRTTPTLSRATPAWVGSCSRCT